MDSCGRFGAYLDVDLGSGEACEKEIPEAWFRTHLGGRGIAARLLLDQPCLEKDPLAPASPLVFATGPFQGLGIPGGGRHAVFARSPRTGTINEAYAGGFWAHELGRSGYDGIIVRGRASSPCYLLIADGRAEVRDANTLWGLNVAETEAALIGRHPNSRVACIGPAGERGVLLACIMNDRNRAAGRPGFGAVMGAKHLKAVVVRGHVQRPVHSQEDLKTSIAEFSSLLARDPALEGLGRNGTVSGVEGLNELGMLPTRNFREGIFEGAERIGHREYERILAGRDNCTACPVRCKRITKTSFRGEPVEERYGGVEYETAAAFGSLCMNDNLDSIALANQKCNAYGLDTISTGVVLAFAMEATEKGMIPRHEGLAWGDAEGMLRMIDMIARREGIGNLLSRGAREAAEELRADFAMHVKGLELALHDPRGKKGLAISYATSPRGATHLEAMHDEMLEGVDAPTPELGITERVDRLSWEKKASMCKTYEDLYSFVNSLIICGFVSWNRLAGGEFYPFPVIRRILHAVTGRKIDAEEMLTIGERNYVIRRLLTARDGHSWSEDCLPDRMSEALPNGPIAGERVDPEILREQLAEYYRLRGFDEHGPTESKLRELGLEALVRASEMS
jgi:aldehyde:ferredoxin oxidoreductase